jgi:hypothetical protein
MLTSAAMYERDSRTEFANPLPGLDGVGSTFGAFCFQSYCWAAGFLLFMAARESRGPAMKARRGESVQWRAPRG